MNIRRFLTFLHARNKEMIRDPAGWVWNIIFPIIMVVGVAFLIGDKEESLYKVGIVGEQGEAIQSIIDQQYLQLVRYQSLDQALAKLHKHQLDIVIRGSEENQFWVNELSARSQMAEKILFSKADTQGFQRSVVSGEKIRYLDWVVTGILGLTIMHACLFGVGFVIVRYRKTGVLKRLYITPLRSFEFLGAHMLSRLLWMIVVIPGLFFIMNVMFDFYMEGSVMLLMLVLMLGALAMLSLALLAASRTNSEESVIGYLNLITWPMVFLSGVWFSLEGAPSILQALAQAFPLTHMLKASRAVMLDGAVFVDIWPSLAALTSMSIVTLSLASARFKW